MGTPLLSAAVCALFEMETVQKSVRFLDPKRGFTKSFMIMMSWQMLPLKPLPGPNCIDKWATYHLVSRRNLQKTASWLAFVLIYHWVNQYSVNLVSMQRLYISLSRRSEKEIELPSLAKKSIWTYGGHLLSLPFAVVVTMSALLMTRLVSPISTS